jgi:hypothetical protein
MKDEILFGRAHQIDEGARGLSRLDNLLLAKQFQ